MPADLQYLRNDTAEALAAFRRLREEMLALLRSLTAAQWQRYGVHPRRGRVTMDWWVAMLAFHDDDHLDQLKRALRGTP